LPPGLSSLNPGKRFNDLARDVWINSRAHFMRWYAAYSILGAWNGGPWPTQ
jgi:hypothetical protein